MGCVNVRSLEHMLQLAYEEASLSVNERDYICVDCTVCSRALLYYLVLLREACVTLVYKCSCCC